MAIKIIKWMPKEMALHCLLKPEDIPDDLYVDMHDGHLRKLRDFCMECKDLLKEHCEVEGALRMKVRGGLRNNGNE